MGVSSVFGAPLLTACLGLGIAVVVATSSSGAPVPSNLNPAVMVSFAFLGVSLLSSLIVIPYNGFVLPRRYAFYLFAIYAAYLVVSVLVAVGVIKP